MGSFIEINDTLQITKEQGFPEELDVKIHQINPYKLEDFEGKVFLFQKKQNIRVYHRPPVRNFLVENREGKWIYWGLIHIIEVNHDYISEETSGKFKIISLFSPKQMKSAHEIVDQNKSTNFFE